MFHLNLYLFWSETETCSKVNIRLQNTTMYHFWFQNADCSYIPMRKWPEILLRQDPKFHWIIPDSADTTVANNDCALDRYR